VGQMVGAPGPQALSLPVISLESCEEIWRRVEARSDEWVTLDR
jgi:hypothetical protein